jgi:hypothetical protein
MKWGWKKSFDFVGSKHPQASPNPGFKTQLQKYQDELGLAD